MAKRFSHPKINSSGNSLGATVSAWCSRAVALRLGWQLNGLTLCGVHPVAGITSRARLFGEL